MIQKILIANRGEIAARIMETCREKQIKTVWPYVAEDSVCRAAHKADTLIAIDSAQDYLNVDKLIKIAKEQGCDAVHPGYGYLSENVNFVEAVTAAGFIFIGPGVDAMKVMGDKLTARQHMMDAGVPVVPGTTDLSDPQRALSEVGLPVLLKASAGGGGKGMRVVQETSAIEGAIVSCRNESMKAFSSDEIYMERYVPISRHIEVQVMTDAHGNINTYGCRDCSLQRRHQKVLEECPPPHLSDELRLDIETAATNAARAVNYVGAGTVEFLLTPDNEFFFLEMNTRLQVEHPVTEMVYGLDLVAEQIAIAQGDHLSTRQPIAQGHSFEARIYAEDPHNNFLPCTGKVHLLDLPEGLGVRVDSHVIEGSTVGLDFDPLLMKIITWGPDREAARQRLLIALENLVLHGVGHNTGFLIDVLRHSDCVEGVLTTSWLQDKETLLELTEPSAEHLHLVQKTAVRRAKNNISSVAKSSFETEVPFNFL